MTFDVGCLMLYIKNNVHTVHIIQQVTVASFSYASDWAIVVC